MIFLAIRGRGRRLRELSVILAFDAARIRIDAENGQPKQLSEYLDELLSPAERFERSIAQLSAKFDAKIARQEKKHG